MGEDFYEKNVKHLTSYTYWRNMIKRCYCDKAQKKCCSSYTECSVDEEWHNFSNFAKWYDKNYYKINDETMCLDKDILIKGNKIYSSETCVFAPQSINSLFESCFDKKRKNIIGVGYIKKDNIFCSRVRINKGYIWLGRFKTEIEAFNAYKIAKEKYIKEVAYKYKDYIPEKLYNAMYNYKVEITD